MDKTFVCTSNRDDSAEGDIIMTAGNDAADWDPFNGVEAPEGWSFVGYVTFALLGPASNDPLSFSPLLRSNTDADRTKDARMEQLLAAMRKTSKVSGDHERQQRQQSSVTMQTNCDIATIALAKAEYEERVDDRRFLALTSQLEGKRLEIDVIARLMTHCNDDEEMVAEHRTELKAVKGEIKAISSEIATWKTKAATTNAFVNNLLENATTVTTTRNESNTVVNVEQCVNDEDDVSS